MPVTKRVVNQFLERKLANYDWMKELPAKEVVREYKLINPRSTMCTTLYSHQMICLLLGVAHEQFLYFLDMGTGKSLLALTLYDYFRQMQGIGSGLVLVPNVINIEGWQEQVEEHCPHFSFVPLVGTSHQKEMALLDPADLYCINYAGLNHLVSTKVASGKKGGGENLKPQDGVIKRLTDRIGFVAFDESQALMNHDSLTSRVCRKIAKQVEFRFAFTGTPAGRDPSAFWNQFMTIDMGDTLGETLGMFRSAFFKSKRNYFSGFPEYIFDDAKLNKLHEVMKNRSISYEASECVDMPQEVEVNKVVALSHTGIDYYKKYQAKLAAAKGNKSLMKNEFMKLRQISSGFLKVKNAKTAKVTVVNLPENPKLDLLLSLMGNVPSARKMVIAYEFIQSGVLLKKALTELGINFAFLGNGLTKQEKRDELRRFKQDPTCVCYLMSHKAGGSGLNLQVANYMFVYETPISSIARQQLLRRVARGGQKMKKVFIFNLLMKGTVDVRILEYCKEGKNLLEILLNGSDELYEDN